jgi:hypothetical protein
MGHLTRKQTKVVRLQSSTGQALQATSVTIFTGLDTQDGIEWVPEPTSVWLNGKQLNCIAHDTFQVLETGEILKAVK